MSGGETDPGARIFAILREGEALVVAPQRDVGVLTDSALMPEIESVLERLRGDSTSRVVVDFEQTTYFGSSMLEALLVLWRHLQASNGRMALCNLSNDEREILRVARFDTLWSICGTRSEALAAVEV